MESAKVPIKILLAIFALTFLSTVSYSVFYSSLTIMLNDTYGFTATDSASMSGLFLGLNYVFQLISGWLIYRNLVSCSRLYILGGIFQAIGSLMLLYTGEVYVYLGLACFLMQSLGCVVTVNMAITQVVEDKGKRSVAFTWNFVAMNLAFVIGYFIGGEMQLIQSYRPFLQASAFFGLLSSLIGAIYWNRLIVEDAKLTTTWGYPKVVLFFIVIVCVTYTAFIYSTISKPTIIACSLAVFSFVFYKAVVVK